MDVPLVASYSVNLLITVLYISMDMVSVTWTKLIIIFLQKQQECIPRTARSLTMGCTGPGCTCPGVYLPGGCTYPGGLPAWGCTCLGGVPTYLGVYLAREVYLPRGYLSRECTCLGVYLVPGVYLVLGVYLVIGSVPGTGGWGCTWCRWGTCTGTPPCGPGLGGMGGTCPGTLPCGQTDTCKNITVAISLQDGKNIDLNMCAQDPSKFIWFKLYTPKNLCDLLLPTTVVAGR